MNVSQVQPFEAEELWCQFQLHFSPCQVHYALDLFKVSSGIMATEEDMALHKAAFEGDIVRVKELLDAGDLDINAYDKHGNTPLILALHFKKNDVVKELLAHGADSGLKTKAGWSPIRYAVASAHLPNIRDIHRANINRERVNLLHRLPSMIASLKAVRI